MKIIVFGAKGRLGQALVERLTADQHEVIPLARADGDLVHASHIPPLIFRYDPHVVINASARNGLETCQKHPFQAMQVNAAAPAAMASACKIRNATLIHFSTDYVFSGDQLGLYENTPTKPWGVYGRTKLWGEEAVAWCAGSHFIFRLSSLYGADMQGVLEPIKQVAAGKGLSPANPVKVLYQHCAPTSTRLVADVVSNILSEFDAVDWLRLSGIYHLATKPRRVGESGVTKVEFAKHLLTSYYGPCPNGAEWCVSEGTLPEPRPTYSVLKTGKFEEAIGYRLPNWSEDLRLMQPLLPKPTEAATVDASRAAGK